MKQRTPVNQASKIIYVQKIKKTLNMYLILKESEETGSSIISGKNNTEYLSEPADINKIRDIYNKIIHDTDNSEYFANDDTLQTLTNVLNPKRLYHSFDLKSFINSLTALYKKYHLSDILPITQDNITLNHDYERLYLMINEEVPLRYYDIYQLFDRESKELDS